MGRKLRGRSLDELRVRGAQALAAWRERAGLDRDLDADGRLARWLAPGVSAAPEALLARFRERPAPFWAAFDDPAATVAALRARCPDDEAQVLARAERVLARRFDLMGHRGLAFGDPIDWQHDPVAGTRAPLAHWSRVPYLDPARVGDHKVVWELSRQQYLATLGQAYWYTGDARYAQGFASLVTDWLDANPPKVGMNWTSSLEVAFRATSWLYALRFFAHAPELTPALYARLVGALHVHAVHLATYLSTYFSPNTHLTGEALGLVLIGSLVPELAGAARWRAQGERILLDQIARQQRADGVYFEQASQYHRYTAEFYLQLLVLTERQGRVPGEALRAAVPRLLEFLAELTRPDGTMPLFGDDDGGRLTQLDGRLPDDLRSLLLSGAVVCSRPEWRWLGDGDEAGTLWWLGPQAASALDALPARPPAGHGRAFVPSGFFVLRDGWHATASHAVVDCGPHGVFNAGHAHADALAVVLTLRGRHLFVDAGTYTYPGPERNAFRGAAAHNTALVDGLAPSVPADGAFQWRHVGEAHATRWVDAPALGLFAGVQSGGAWPPDVAHAREIVRVADRGWLVRDRLRAAGPHALSLGWLLAPGLRATVAAGGPDALPIVDVHTLAGDPVARVVVVGPGRWETEEAWVSPQYGTRTPATRLRWVAETLQGDDPVVTCILPPAADGLPTVRLASCEGEGRALLISPSADADTREDEVLLLRQGTGTLRVREVGHAVAHDVATDAACAWIWGAGAAVATLGGEFLALAGESIVRGGDLMPGVPHADRWTTAVRESGGWRVHGGTSTLAASRGA
ncbi:hypothetical protein rosag_49990 [Roseisolibacter agri]|uniref:Heparin-sulfate lyase N-terminal domain-containing protein n=1 Tax=Roseisolibacter agri TaxID=2014610 RepID=A0AA37QER1_9BACT|nr:hypothetical protein rosag_49990 [Roseisolibacter agri]